MIGKQDKDLGPTGSVMIKNQLERQADLKTMTFYTHNCARLNLIPCTNTKLC